MEEQIQVEGLLPTVRIAFIILSNLSARKRVMHMRSVFNRSVTHLGAIAIVAVKS